MTAKVTPASTPVFVNPDGVNGPEGATGIGWSVQGNVKYPGKGKTPVFTSSADGTATPAAVSGWTAQVSNQNLVANPGVL